jgi:hypothetical protein
VTAIDFEVEDLRGLDQRLDALHRHALIRGGDEQVAGTQVARVRPSLRIDPERMIGRRLDRRAAGGDGDE